MNLRLLDISTKKWNFPRIRPEPALSPYSWPSFGSIQPKSTPRATTWVPKKNISTYLNHKKRKKNSQPPSHLQNGIPRNQPPNQPPKPTPDTSTAQPSSLLPGSGAQLHHQALAGSIRFITAMNRMAFSWRHLEAFLRGVPYTGEGSNGSGSRNYGAERK